MTVQPNIILIVMDSVRAANLSCYGYPRVTTPNLDTIATQSALFEQAISVGCWTLPVHASLFTGLYPLSHNVTVSRDALPDNFPTLARQLKEANYQTACFSNNAYISDVTGLTQGFDTVENIWRVSNPRGTQRTKLGKLIKNLESKGPLTRPVIALIRKVQRVRMILKRQRNQSDKGGQLTNNKIQDWLTKDRNPDVPFFLFVNYMECHEPYNPPHPYNRRFMAKRYTPSRVAQIGTKEEIASRVSEQRGQEDLEILQALYDGEINYLDHKIGELVHFIETLSILDNTVLVITSDHGDSLGEHHQIGHRITLYEQLVHVPLLIRYPKRFQPNTRVAQQVSLIDLYSTLLELAGVKSSPVTTNGSYSLTKTPSNGDEIRPFTIAENVAPKSLNGVTNQMIRTNTYKYIWKSNRQHELYNLINDPRELHNVAAKESEVVDNLDKQLEAWRQSVQSYQVETNQVQYDDTLVERLQALGYME